MMYRLRVAVLLHTKKVFSPKVIFVRVISILFTMSVQQGPLDLSELAGTVCVVTGAGNNGIGYGIAEVACGSP